MRKPLLAVGVLFALALPANAFAVYGGGQLKAKKCGSGPLVVNVSENIIGDADSGLGGNTWAFDTYLRTIQVVQTGPGVFCAITTYKGTSLTNAGASPQNTGTVAGGVKATMQGGLRSDAFSASFTPTQQTTGYLGTINYNCDINANCPGYVNWTEAYFNSGAGATYNDAYWAWRYKSKHNGTWINALAGNVGDITSP